MLITIDVQFTCPPIPEHPLTPSHHTVHMVRLLTVPILTNTQHRIRLPNSTSSTQCGRQMLQLIHQIQPKAHVIYLDDLFALFITILHYDY